MIKTGIRKELMLLTRSGKLAGVIAVIFALSVFEPLLYKVMQEMMAAMPEMYESVGAPDETTEALKSMSSLFADLTPASMAAQCIAQICGTASLVIMFIFMSAAGGEQKKRSVIIPRCSGLTPAMYAVPKFIVYPLLVFVCSFAAVLAGTGVSSLMFEGTVDMSLIMLSALATAFYMAFITVLQLSVGLSTGMPGVAVVASIAAVLLIPSVMQMFRVDRFNPFALQSIAASTAILSGGAQASGTGLGSMLETTVKGSSFDSFDFTVSVIVTVIISVMLCLATVFAISAKQLDNRGDEPML